MLFTLHTILDEIEYLCNKIIFLDKRKLILEGNTRKLIDKMSEVKHEKSNLYDLFMQVLRGGENA